MPIILNTFLIKLFRNRSARLISLFQKLLFRALWCPLKRCKRLWNKERCTSDNLHLASPFFFWYCIIKGNRNLVGKLRNSANILLCLRWQPQHKIELNPIPSTLKCQSGTLYNIFFCQTFVNNISQTLASCLRRKCQATFSHILYLPHHIK